MSDVLRLPFLPRIVNSGDTTLVPMLPLRLMGACAVSVDGLLDTGAAINVLLWSTGLQLGLDWSAQQTSVTLTGNLGDSPARAVLLDVRSPDVPRHLAHRFCSSTSCTQPSFNTGSRCYNAHADPPNEFADCTEQLMKST